MSLLIEQGYTVSHTDCDAVSEEANNSLLKGQKWNGLLPALIEAGKAFSAEQHEVALHIFLRFLFSLRTY